MAEWEWDELEDLMKILVDTEASRDEQYDLIVVKVNKIIKAVNVLMRNREDLEEFLKHPEEYIMYNIYSDNDE